MAVGDHEREAVRRVVRIEGQIGPARLEDRQQANHHFRRSLQADAHRQVGPDMVTRQMAGQLVGAAVQLGEGELPPLEIDGDCLGAPRDLGLDQLVQAGGVLVVLGRVVPLHEDLPPLAVGQDGHEADRLVRVGGNRLQEGLEMPHHALDGRGIEQIDVVLDFGLQSGLGSRAAKAKGRTWPFDCPREHG